MDRQTRIRIQCHLDALGRSFFFVFTFFCYGDERKTKRIFARTVREVASSNDQTWMK